VIIAVFIAGNHAGERLKYWAKKKELSPSPPLALFFPPFSLRLFLFFFFFFFLPSWYGQHLPIRENGTISRFYYATFEVATTMGGFRVFTSLLFCTPSLFSFLPLFSPSPLLEETGEEKMDTGLRRAFLTGALFTGIASFPPFFFFYSPLSLLSLLFFFFSFFPFFFSEGEMTEHCKHQLFARGFTASADIPPLSSSFLSSLPLFSFCSVGSGRPIVTKCNWRAIP